METGRNEMTSSTGGLTDRQKRLVDVLNGGDGDLSDFPTDTEVALAAGYAHGRELGLATASKAVQGALQTARTARIRATLASKALKAIEQLVEGSQTPAATRFAASKWVLEQAGHNSQADDGRDKPLHEMTEAELLAFMAKASAVIEQGGEGPIITVTPGDGALPS